ncbi:bifunctional 2-polyprenyl-6-hydroxyphenol methylase/3-demethylubiquinol 3-O-methyltransferase UbiG [Gilvimarinus xylanilyticus]|uniref:Ubiquinone biosynthesis O-methyltransferase n=1 Tax=Gilvimarinus xylanilyticus TaxID=2944139 RepID=A0A9X2HTT1_9GAMM|nr:bifunctional 2-polyprenyl-6-hydroxyphenol methylase/3-demethylubiquinol 3-O-methyltransferase UbiG [Gilvimarinus xylanilyticus]MCP8898353.1 bifunctional 2-polyprenyl-6-hydroxyphenol methylase/3-demethylubiquinol 3-O-methyltransferase UbiG [Gilvimarinus xylanilyticus]
MNDSHASQNSDAAELAKFEHLAQRWWEPEGEFRPLHDMNPVRTNYIDARSPLAEKMVLDVGCGGGILTEAMAQRGAQVTGLDLGEAPLAVARQHAEQSGLSIEYRCISVEELARQEPGRYDIVTCLEMLEHVPDPASVVSACARLLKPGGSAYFSTINRNLKAWGMAVVGAEYILKLLPKGTHDYSRFIRPSELGRDVREADLELQDISGITYNPLTRRFKLDPTDVDVNYILHATKADTPEL